MKYRNQYRTIDDIIVILGLLQRDKRPHFLLAGPFISFKVTFYCKNWSQESLLIM